MRDYFKDSIVYAEKTLLIIVAIATLFAALIEIKSMILNMNVSLAELLLLFIYSEMHCCILKCTFPPFISIYRARDLVFRFVEPILEEFNYIPPDKEVQDFIVNFLVLIVPSQRK